MTSYAEKVGDLENELGFVIAEIEEYTTRVEELLVERARLERELEEVKALDL